MTLKLEHELPTADEVRALTACEKCGAPIGEVCQNDRQIKHGNLAKQHINHQERIRAARRIMRERRLANNRN